MRILLVEDDRGIGDAVRAQIAAEGHTPDLVTTLADARACLDTVAYDLILLDLMLPDGGGLGFLRALRRSGSATPVIILTARDRITERIECLNTGADDYLVKPFDLDELSARMGAVARRYAGNPNPLIELGGLAIDIAARRVTGPQGEITLSQREWAVFEALLQRPGSIVPKSALEERLYSFDAEVESNTIEVYVSRLRRKLGRGSIETLRGLGYRLGRG
ncbi:two-component system OmpR family response regulator [Pseudochelatococcus lubricantis]|uniref:Two-component system OmpR family response regulator n=1 Tax=Pseudochelatococcus lubricantis TaxID=1538102 RepID=A0ABX0UTY8_9HYPH|nr:response regulator transcription factor [Pseudochelatococcus lubricantis]NIJ56426.1 two-component system OmpR family response regulator [Pseudochelatococcus lubricantis]